MKVNIKEFNVDMEIKNKGIELDVSDNNGRKGDLIVTKADLIWCKGKTTKDKGKKISWSDFIEFMESR